MTQNLNMLHDAGSWVLQSSEDMLTNSAEEFKRFHHTSGQEMKLVDMSSIF